MDVDEVYNAGWGHVNFELLFHGENLLDAGRFGLNILEHSITLTGLSNSSDMDDLLDIGQAHELAQKSLVEV